MADDAHMIGANLLKTGTLVNFRIVEEEPEVAAEEVPAEGAEGEPATEDTSTE